MNSLYNTITNHFNNLSNYKTKEISDYAKTLIKNKTNVSALKPYIKDNNIIYRIYFQVSLHEIKEVTKQIEFIVGHEDIFNDWWHIDTLLQFLKRPSSFDDVYKYSVEFVNSPLCFTRRLGYVIMLKSVIKEASHFDQIIKLFKDDDEYYCQMAMAWLLQDMCVYEPVKVIDYIINSKLKYNILGKAISKINDSFKISVDVKETLIKHRNQLKAN